MNTIKRWYYILFRRKECIRCFLSEPFFVYGDVVKISRRDEEYKYLGKGWMIKLKK